MPQLERVLPRQSKSASTYIKVSPQRLAEASWIMWTGDTLEVRGRAVTSTRTVRYSPNLTKVNDILYILHSFAQLWITQPPKSIVHQCAWCSGTSWSLHPMQRRWFPIYVMYFFNFKKFWNELQLKYSYRWWKCKTWAPSFTFLRGQSLRLCAELTPASWQASGDQGLRALAA